MKTIHKLLLALGTVLALVTVALVLLVRGALGVTDKVLDATANTVDAAVAKVKAADSPARPDTAKTDATPPAPSADAPPANASPDAPSQAANANAPADKTPDAQSDSPKTTAAPTPAGKPNAKNDSDDDTLVSMGKLFGMVFGDDEGDFNPADVLTSSDNPDKDAANQADKQAGKADKLEDKTGLAGIVPGADSPTLQKAMAGKYKGKEGQIIDDVLDDPKAWRLLFFLSGGM